MPLSPVQIKEKLLQGIDEDSNIINASIVAEVINLLEKTALTITDLQITRLGRYINDIRKKTTDRSLSARCRKLVKSWQRLAPSSSNNNGSPASAGYSPASVRFSNSPSRNASPCLQSNHSSPALQPNYAQHVSSSTRIVSPLVRQTAQQKDTLTAYNTKVAPASPMNSAYSKRISPGIPRHSVHTVNTPKHSSVPSPQTKSHKASKLPNSTLNNSGRSTPTNNHTSHTPNTDSTNRAHAGNKKRRRSEDSITSDTSSVKKSRPIVNGDLRPSERVKTPKVKTTVELIAELQAQNKTNLTASDTINKIVTNQIKKEEDDINMSIVPASAKPRPRRKNGALACNPPEAPSDLSKTKSDMVQRFLHFQQENLSSPSAALDEPDSIVVDVDTVSPEKTTTQTIKDPYALLPPLDLDSITWSDDDNDEAHGKTVRRNPITGEYPEGYEPNQLCGDTAEPQVTKVLTENWHGVTGTNVSSHSEFHDWTQTFTISASDCDKDNVYVLPYVDI